MATGDDEGALHVEGHTEGDIGEGGHDDGEDGFVDGEPEVGPAYLEDIWEYLVGASAAEDWESAMNLWARLEQKLGYPEGRVSIYMHGERIVLMELTSGRGNHSRLPR